MVALRSIFPEDRDRMLDILTDETVKKTYMLPDFNSREDAQPLFLRLMEMSSDDTKYVRAVSLNEQLIGFLNHTNIRNSSIELGYVIHPDFQGRGYMTEALFLSFDELFSLGYREIVTGAFAANKASLRVMEKCGMERMKKTDEIAYRGAIHPCIYYHKKTGVR